MNKEERQELRKWSAVDLMGWFKQDQMVLIGSGKEVSGYFNEHGLVCYVDDWAPDSPDAPAWQIEMVIKRMKELGWSRLYVTFLSTSGMIKVAAKFRETMCNYLVTDWIEADNLFEAILLAAEAAWPVKHNIHNGKK